MKIQQIIFFYCNRNTSFDKKFKQFWISNAKFQKKKKVRARREENSVPNCEIYSEMETTFPLLGETILASLLKPKETNSTFAMPNHLPSNASISYLSLFLSLSIIMYYLSCLCYAFIKMQVEQERGDNHVV